MNNLTRRSFLTKSLSAAAIATGGLAVRAAEGPSAGSSIKRIYITHFSHTDVGFTDLPSVTRELHQRYIDIALDKIIATMQGPADRKFYWTCESMLGASDWWQAASSARRNDFLKAVGSGQLAVTALACNQTPFLDAAQWHTMLHWVADDLWRQFKPTVALQDDVNGFPRAGALALLDRGVTRLVMGINSDSGGPPFYRPSAFWWKMPDGRRLFVWLNLVYPEGYDFFETAHWRRGPVVAASDTRYRPPRAGDFFRTDEASLRAAHAQCLRRLERLKSEGYPYDVLTIPMTSHWRMDNDPPFLPLSDFVAAWNKLGLKPELVLTTVSRAAQIMEEASGAQAPEHQGEFTDWWANGTASAPREVAASRLAKRLLAAAQSPLWGAMAGTASAKAETISKDLCLFDEHTWGSSWSVGLPWSSDTQAQFAEKSVLAWRSMGQAQWLLSQRVRSRLLRAGEGLFVANPSRETFSGWVRLPANCLRGDYHSLLNPATGARMALQFEKGMQSWTDPKDPSELTPENTAAQWPDNAPNQTARFWVDKLAPSTFVRLTLETQPAANNPAAVPKPKVQLDASGWPFSAQWENMKVPLFLAGIGDFSAIKVNGFAPRAILRRLSGAGSSPRGEDLRKQHIETVPAAGEAQVLFEDTPFTQIYTQWLSHPRLLWAQRRLEIWKQEPRARLTLRFNRLSSEAPEAFFANFALPCPGTLPRFSCGGTPFTPFQDQLPGTCRDYFAIDGWADYATPDGHWLWVSRDAPLVTLDSPQVWTRRQTPPAHPERLLAMLFNNFWFTNFVADEHGIMEFQFDLVWRSKLDPPATAALAEALVAEPVVLLNQGGADDPILMQRLFRP